LIDGAAYVLLQDVIRREGRSFLQYAGESFPWTTVKEKESVVRLKTLVAEERAGAASLSRLLSRNRLTPPYLGPYPSYFTSYNYLSMDKLLPLLVVHQKRSIQALEKDLSELQDGAARKEVQQALAMKNRHLGALEALTAGKPLPAEGTLAEKGDGHAL
jgi:hypothetical protein